MSSLLEKAQEVLIQEKEDKSVNAIKRRLKRLEYFQEQIKDIQRQIVEIEKGELVSDDESDRNY